MNKILNIEDRYKLFVWLYPRTGSMLFTKIFDDAGFNAYELDNGKLNLKSSDIFHNHDLEIPPNINEYKLILTCRNPYSMIVSHYMNFQKPKDYSFEISEIQPNFLIWLERMIESYEIWNELLYKLTYIEVDFPIRLENLLEDYLSLPNITQSKFYKNSTLQNFLLRKNNETDSSMKGINFRSFYNRNSSDLVYYSFQNYFKLFGYDKNSWK